MEVDDEAPSQIACCLCGVLTAPNGFNTCMNCVKYQVDITEGIPKKSQVYRCMKCERFLQPPSKWIYAEMESMQLMSVCLKKLPGLSKVHLVNASFIYTEPHSKKLLVELTVQKRILEKEMLEQKFIIEFTIINQICEECQRAEAKDYWKAVVQVRQKIDHKRTLFYLEQVLLTKGVHTDASFIETSSNGLDLFFSSEIGARKLVATIGSYAPTRVSTSKSLVSHDIHSNAYNYKYVFSVEIVPLCKDCIVCLPKGLSARLGNLGPICLCYRVTKRIYLIDPNTMKSGVISAGDYYRHPFVPFSSVHQMKRFLVLDVSKIPHDKGEMADDKHSNKLLRRFVHADVWLARDDDSSYDGEEIHCRSHLGHQLKVGDSVLGYDLSRMNFNDDNMTALPASDVPTVVLVKKIVPKKRKNRKWKLKRMEQNYSDDGQFDDFMNDIEEDPEIRNEVTFFAGDAENEQALTVEQVTEMFDRVNMSDTETESTIA